LIYTAQRSTSPSGPWIDAGGGSSSSSPLNVVGQPTNVGLWFRVKEDDESGGIRYSEPVFTLMLDIPEPTATGGLHASGILLEWPVTCATQYRIYKYSVHSMEYLLLVETSEESFLDVDVSNNVTYYYYVTAVSMDGLESDPSVIVSSSITQGGVFSMSRSSQYQGIQIGLESVAGTVVPTTKKLVNMELQMTPQLMVKTIKYPGAKGATDTQRGQEHSEGRFSGVMDFNLLYYILYSMFGAPTTTTPAGATNARQHVFKPDSNAPLTPKSFTVEQGSSRGAERWPFVIFTELVCRWTREDASIEGSVFGADERRNITMTPDVKVTLTATAADGATTLAVTALSGPIADNTVIYFPGGLTATVDGAVLALATSITVDALADELVSGSIGHTLPQIAAQAVEPYAIGVYRSDDGATFTKLTDNLDGEFRLAGLWKPVFHRNDSNPSFDDVVELNPDFAATMTQEEGTEVDDWITDLKNGDKIWLGIRAVGGLIETGSPNQYYLLQFRMPVVVVKPDPGNKDDVYGNTISFEMAQDQDYGMCDITLVNLLTAP
jgi:hypothetical protein